MIISANSDNSDFKQVPAGMHLARCYRITDLGTQKSEFQGQVKYNRKIMVQFEVHGEDADGNTLLTDKNEPMSVSKRYTRSLAEKAALRADLISWRGREFTSEELNSFDLKNILGAWAMLSIVKSASPNGKEYTNIANVNPVPASIKRAGLPQGHNELIEFDIDNFDAEIYNKMSKGIKAVIEGSPEWKARQDPVRTQPAKTGSGFDDMEDDIPF